MNPAALAYQRNYNANKRRAGLCGDCHEKALSDSSLCGKHLLSRRLRMRAVTGSKPYRKGGGGRPPRIPDPEPATCAS